jgi:DNA-binding NarL/FixJ family response regulator
VNHHPVRVLLTADHDIVRHGVRGMLAAHRDRIELVEPSAAGEPADVEILDATGPGSEAVDALSRPGPPPAIWRVVLVDEGTSPALARRALALGASGVVATSDPAGALADAVVRAGAGAVVLSRSLEGVAGPGGRWPGEELGLSRRESQVLVMIAGGNSPDDIASGLGIAHETVRSHLKRIYQKLRVRDRATAVAKAWREGIVDRHTVHGDQETPPSESSREASPTGAAFSDR